MAPQKDMSIFESPKPVNATLLGKRVSADVIKLRRLRWGDHNGMSWWSLNPVTSILIRMEERLDTLRREKGKPM